VIVIPHVGREAAAQDAVTLGQPAEQAGNMREALRHYTAGLQAIKRGSAEAVRLHEKIIDLVRSLEPRPAIPLEAERHFVRGGAPWQSWHDSPRTTKQLPMSCGKRIAISILKSN